MISGTVISVEQDARTGAVLVTTEYRDDGVLVQMGRTRYSNMVTYGKDKIIEVINADVEKHCQSILIKKHIASENTASVSDVAPLAIGIEKQVTQASFNTRDEKITVADDGTVNKEPLPEGTPQ